MFAKYFFVPASNVNFLNKSLSLVGIDFRVLDFEDSIRSSDINRSYENISQIKLLDTDWVRLPINEYLIELVIALYKSGIKNFIIPKFHDKGEFGKIMNILLKYRKDFKVIALVENAKAYLQLQTILEEWTGYIYGISLGSHDFASSTNLKHGEKELFNLRLHISLIASANEIMPIDIASMNISDEKEYNREIQEGFDLGYRAKFILHPFQLDLVNKYAFYTIDEVDMATQVLDIFNRDESNIVIKHKGRIYEKPHISSLQKIQKWGEKFYGTNR